MAELRHTVAMTTTKQIPTWTTGERLAKARKLMGWTQQRMADELGISRRTVTRVEDGVTNPSRAVLIAWAELTGVSLEWITADMPPVTLRYRCAIGPPVTSPQVTGHDNPKAA